MKILIKGHAGSGKSTLGKILSRHYRIPVLHLDSVYWLPEWQHRNDDEFNKIVLDFMKKNDSWIIEGNYTRIAPSRNDEADMTIILDYNRFFCLRSIIRRFKENKGHIRDDLGLEDKIDFEFVWWVLFKGRTRQRRKNMQKMIHYNKNVLVFKNRRQLKNYLKQNGIKEGV